MTVFYEPFTFEKHGRRKAITVNPGDLLKVKGKGVGKYLRFSLSSEGMVSLHILTAEGFQCVRPQIARPYRPRKDTLIQVRVRNTKPVVVVEAEAPSSVSNAQEFVTQTLFD